MYIGTRFWPTLDVHDAGNKSQSPLQVRKRDSNAEFHKTPPPQQLVHIPTQYHTVPQNSSTTATWSCSHLDLEVFKSTEQCFDQSYRAMLWSTRAQTQLVQTVPSEVFKPTIVLKLNRAQTQLVQTVPSEFALIQSCSNSACTDRTVWVCIHCDGDDALPNQSCCSTNCV